MISKRKCIYIYNFGYKCIYRTTNKRNNAEYRTTKNTNDLTEAITNKYYATTLFNADLANKNNNDLMQGTTNKYCLLTLAQADAKIAISSTDSAEI